MPGLIEKAMSFVGWESGGAYLGAAHSLFGGDMSVTRLGGSNFEIGIGYDMPGLLSGDFTTAGLGGRIVGGHKAGIGTVKLLDLATESEYQIERQGTLFVAKYAMGHGVIRPECCVEMIDQ